MSFNDTFPSSPVPTGGGHLATISFNADEEPRRPFPPPPGRNRTRAVEIKATMVMTILVSSLELGSNNPNLINPSITAIDAGNEMHNLITSASSDISLVSVPSIDFPIFFLTSTYSFGSQCRISTSKQPSSSLLAIAVTSLRIRNSTPLSTAFSARAIANSYGITFPASGAYNAPIQSGFKAGSISNNSFLSRMRKFWTPLIFPLAKRSSNTSNSFVLVANTNDPFF
mmetsp:Transcript_15557/g.24134  ORF Transcript_15557/g.24134 Transcript_15557/m.24134 type:complete len:227 (-) Transcript_15557:607-1287(-)